MLPGVVSGGLLIRLALWGQRVFPTAVEPAWRLLIGYLPLVLAGVLGAALLCLGVARAGTHYEFTPGALRVHRRGRTLLLRWESLHLHRVGDRGLYSSAVLDDGQATLRLERFFLPDFERLCKMIERAASVKRAATPRVE